MQKALVTCVLILWACLGSGCNCDAGNKVLAVKPGATQIPVTDECLVFLNIHVTSHGKDMLGQPWGGFVAAGVSLMDVQTNESLRHYFSANPFITGSFTAPARTGRHEENGDIFTDRSVIMSMPPGEYKINHVDINSGDGTYQGQVAPRDEMRLVIPKQEFISLGTLQITIAQKKGLGDAFKRADKTIALRSISDTEAEFAYDQYPVLQSKGFDLR